MSGTIDVEQSDEIVISRRPGQTVARVGFMLQLLFRGGHERDVRHRIADVIADFARCGAPHVSQFQKRMSNRMSPIGERDLAAFLHREVDNVDPDIDAYRPHVTDDADNPTWQGAALMHEVRALPQDLSLLKLAMPRDVASDPDELILTLLRWIEATQPLHGTAGFAPIFSIGMSGRYPNQTWPTLSRYSGLDHQTAFTMAARGVDQIRTVNWLTILGTKVVNEIGGIDKITALLDAAATEFNVADGEAPVTYAFNGGIVIRAGEYPELGDREHEGVPTGYRVVGRALRRWIFTDYQNRPGHLLKVPEPLDAHFETINWVTRFDV